MLAYQVTIAYDTATPTLRALSAGLTPAQIHPVVGRAASETTRQHFQQLNRDRPNRLGGQRTNYYLAAARSTHFDVVDDGVIISVNQIGLRLHYYGGTIRAGRNLNPRTGRPTKFLTIPARAEAHGKRASEFPDLEVLWGRHGPYALARIQRTNIAFGKLRADGHRRVLNRGTVGGEILFWLKPSVTLPEDRSLLPAPDRLYGAALGALNAYVDRLIARGAGK